MKSDMKKLPLILWTCFLCLFLVKGTAAAEEAYQTLPTISEVYVNPLYADVVSEEEVAELGSYAVAPLADDVEYVSEAKAVSQIKEQFKNRVETIVVYVETTRADRKQMLSDLMNASLEHTKNGNPVEGDYMRWQYGGWSGSNGGYSIGDTYYLTVSYVIAGYYTTAEQEAAMDAKVAELISSLELQDSSKSSYQKIKAIYDYLCGNVVYDYTNLDDSDYKLKFTGYAALVNGTAVCQGYAVAFYRLALESGIDARLISGTGNGGGHGWNIVEFNGKYYNLDATWDANYTPATYKYFLRCTANFTDHSRDAEYDTEEFHTQYPMGSTDAYICEISGHVEEIDKAEEATCTDTGLTEGSHCSVCGDTIVAQEVVEKKAHTPETDAAVEATCSSTGLTEGSHCSVCKEVLVAQEVVEKKAHTPETDAAVEATCTSTGLTEGSHCSVCKEVLVAQEAVEKKAHTPEMDAAVEATCTSTGLTEGSHCSVCKEVLAAQEVVEKKAHTPETDAAVEATCTSTGLTEGSHCSVCKEVLVAQEVVKANGHTSVTDKAVEATCTNTGLTEGSHCSVCKEVFVAQEVVEKKAHTPETDAAVEATCSSTGLTEGSHCSVCKEVFVAQEVVEKKAHTPDPAVKENEKAATCQANATYESVVYCKDCRTEISRTAVTVENSITDHTPVTDKAVEATCASTGLTEGSHCSVCKEVLVAQEVVEMKRHTLVTVPAVEATCTSTGLTAGCRCSGCNAFFITPEAVPMKAHTPDEAVKENEKAATCQANATYESVIYCKDCETEISRTLMTVENSAKGHTFGQSVQISAATVQSPAMSQKTCTTCGHKETESVGSALKAKISVNASSLVLKTGQKTTAFQVSFENGDYVKSWKSSNTKIVKVTGKKNGSCTIKAQKKTGSAKITVTLASGKKKTIKVKVQKKAVTTTSLKLAKTKLTLKKGKKLTLEPIIKPITSQSGVKYTTSNKKVASVSAKGVVKGLKVGTAKITVKSGTKKVVCTIKVTK